MDKKKSAQKETLLKVLKYVRHYWPFLILSIAAAAVTVVLTLYVPIEEPGISENTDPAA